MIRHRQVAVAARARLSDHLTERGRPIRPARVVMHQTAHVFFGDKGGGNARVGFLAAFGRQRRQIEPRKKLRFGRDGEQLSAPKEPRRTEA